jgi:hypothetical protein
MSNYALRNDLLADDRVELMDGPPVSDFGVNLKPERVAERPLRIEQLEERASAVPIGFFDSIPDAASCL